MGDIIRIANCSGFYGDKLSAAREMVEGGPIDVLTGDYLAELTMAILHSQKMQRPTGGYVGTFLKQLRDVLAQCVERDIRVVTNAGGLNPEGMAAAVEALAAELSLEVSVAYVDGDDLMPDLAALQEEGEAFINMDTGAALASTNNTVLTANADLGAWGIAEALKQGAQVVICPRVTDAAVVMGPAAWRFGWQRDDFDALAGALTAGHIIECGQQATGGNYAFFEEVPSFDQPGYPIAEIEPSGDFTITKHPGTAGLVSVGTVTAQLLYEIGAPAYLNPDVIAHFDSLHIEQAGKDRVRVSGCRGSAPPPTHKVCINTLGGYRNGFDIHIAGLDIEQKAQLVADTFVKNLGGAAQFDELSVQLIRTDKPDPQSNEEAFARLRVIAKSQDQAKVGRLFSARMVELALANIPGLGVMTPLGNGDPFLAYWPAPVNSKHILERVHINGNVSEVPATSTLDLPRSEYTAPNPALPSVPTGETSRIALGRLFGARSGDKGGHANLGVWARDAISYSFLHDYLSVEQLKALLPDVAAFDVDRYALPNVFALNFVIRGLLGEGVSSSTRLDPQAKSLGEYFRARVIDVPRALVSAANLERYVHD